MLAVAVREHGADVLIDCVNTASGISYQDVYTNSIEVRKSLDFISERIDDRDFKQISDNRKDIERTFETLLLSQSIPQLIRHTQLIYRAMVTVGTRVYIKVGTTGTGGMGLNIPYTHGEDKPSAKLMSKTAIGFAHTGLMFLMARTPGGPIVKEIKPGAMIGYKKVTYQSLKHHRDNTPIFVYAPRSQRFDGELELSMGNQEFKKLGELEMVGVDTGENGFFARGEFEAVTSINQMEFVTPEEIANNVVLEIKGSNTGVDVIAAIDSAIMVPSYRAGYLRGSAIEAMRRLEHETNSHSIATGELGPPKLTKLLYEAHLLKTKYRTLQAVVDQSAEEVSEALWRYVQRNQDLRNTMISIGIPILPPDGDRLVRGPRINVPEYAGQTRLPVTAASIDRVGRTRLARFEAYQHSSLAGTISPHAAIGADHSSTGVGRDHDGGISKRGDQDRRSGGLDLQQRRRGLSDQVVGLSRNLVYLLAGRYVQAPDASRLKGAQTVL